MATEAKAEPTTAPVRTSRTGRRLAIVGLFAVVIAGWLVLDADSGARQAIASLWDQVTGGSEPERPLNWGDVAAKVGEFAEEEQALRAALGSGVGDPQIPPPTSAP